MFLQIFNRTVDKAVMRPVARGYKAIIPAFIRKGVHNFFSNLFETQVFLNDVIQLRLEDAMHTAWRFTVNSTAGVGGLFDVAKNTGLPHRDNDLGATFYHWGWRESQYTVTPIFGPATTRDSIGFTIEDFVLTPFILINNKVVRYSLSALDRISHRTQLLKAEPTLDTALDPYVMVRNAYFQKRNRLLKGKDGANGDEEDGRDEATKSSDSDVTSDTSLNDDPYVEE